MAWRSSGASNDQLVDKLRDSGLLQPRAERAMRQTDRAIYVRNTLTPRKSKSYNYGPYADAPQSIGAKMTISAPFVHAAALSAIEHKLKNSNHAHCRILDVGCGSGVLVACLARMFESHQSSLVVGIDVVPQLVDLSIANLTADGLLPDGEKIVVALGDGWKGVEEFAPFDAIHVGAAADEIPEALVRQLKPEGVLIIPL